jgi:hypothetical protein
MKALAWFTSVSRTVSLQITTAIKDCQLSPNFG